MHGQGRSRDRVTRLPTTLPIGEIYGQRVRSAAPGGARGSGVPMRHRCPPGDPLRPSERLKAGGDRFHRRAAKRRPIRLVAGNELQEPPCAIGVPPATPSVCQRRGPLALQVLGRLGGPGRPRRTRTLWWALLALGRSVIERGVTAKKRVFK
jgi:hypothetical protein